MSSSTFVYNTAIPQFTENRIFDPSYAAKFPGSLMLAILGERARQEGWEVMTADVFLRAPSKCAICISDMVTPYTQALFSHGVIPAVILSEESPNVAWKFYSQLKKYTSKFHHAYLFRGALTHVSPLVQTHPFYWPNPQRTVIYNRLWHNREYMVMVASNKDRFGTSRRKAFQGLHRFAKWIIWNGLQRINPLFRFEDLYQKRMDAILYFAEIPGFRLYGTGWDNPDRRSIYVQAAKRAGATPVEDKLKAIADFRFSLCFENCSFPGYVTEKIFDCFFSSCIPVYCGAPDINDFVPVETFVDARQFNSWIDLDRYLRAMPESEAQRYITAAHDFIASDTFKKFDQEYYVTELMDILETEFANIK